MSTQVVIEKAEPGHPPTQPENDSVHQDDSWDEEEVDKEEEAEEQEEGEVKEEEEKKSESNSDQDDPWGEKEHGPAQLLHTHDIFTDDDGRMNSAWQDTFLSDITKRYPCTGDETVSGIRTRICPWAEKTVIRNACIEAKIQIYPEAPNTRVTVNYPRFGASGSSNSKTVPLAGHVDLILHTAVLGDVVVIVNALVLDFSSQTGDLLIGRDVLEMHPFLLIHLKMDSMDLLSADFASLTGNTRRSSEASYWSEHPEHLHIFIGVSEDSNTGGYKLRSSYGIFFRSGSIFNSFGTIIWPDDAASSKYRHAATVRKAVCHALIIVTHLLEVGHDVDSVTLVTPKLDSVFSADEALVQAGNSQNMSMSTWISDLKARGIVVSILSKDPAFDFSQGPDNALDHLIKIAHQAYPIPEQSKFYDAFDLFAFDPIANTLLHFPTNSVEEGLLKSDKCGLQVGQRELMDRYGFIPCEDWPLLEPSTQGNIQFISLPAPFPKIKCQNLHDYQKPRSARQVSWATAADSSFLSSASSCSSWSCLPDQDHLKDLVLARDENYNGYVGWKESSGLAGRSKVEGIVRLHKKLGSSAPWALGWINEDSLGWSEWYRNIHAELVLANTGVADADLELPKGMASSTNINGSSAVLDITFGTLQDESSLDDQCQLGVPQSQKSEEGSTIEPENIPRDTDVQFEHKDTVDISMDTQPSCADSASKQCKVSTATSEGEEEVVQINYSKLASMLTEILAKNSDDMSKSNRRKQLDGAEVSVEQLGQTFERQFNDVKRILDERPTPTVHHTHNYGSGPVYQGENYYAKPVTYSCAVGSQEHAPGPNTTERTVPVTEVPKTDPWSIDPTIGFTQSTEFTDSFDYDKVCKIQNVLSFGSKHNDGEIEPVTYKCTTEHRCPITQHRSRAGRSILSYGCISGKSSSVKYNCKTQHGCPTTFDGTTVPATITHHCENQALAPTTTSDETHSGSLIAATTVASSECTEIEVEAENSPPMRHSSVPSSTSSLLDLAGPEFSSTDVQIHHTECDLTSLRKEITAMSRQLSRVESKVKSLAESLAPSEETSVTLAYDIESALTLFQNLRRTSRAWHGDIENITKVVQNLQDRLEKKRLDPFPELRRAGSSAFSKGKEPEYIANTVYGDLLGLSQQLDGKARDSELTTPPSWAGRAPFSHSSDLNPVRPDDRRQLFGLTNRLVAESSRRGQDFETAPNATKTARDEYSQFYKLQTLHGPWYAIDFAVSRISHVIDTGVVPGSRKLDVAFENLKYVVENAEHRLDTCISSKHSLPCLEAAQEVTARVRRYLVAQVVESSASEAIKSLTKLINAGVVIMRMYKRCLVTFEASEQDRPQQFASDALDYPMTSCKVDALDYLMASCKDIWVTREKRPAVLAMLDDNSRVPHHGPMNTGSNADRYGRVEEIILESSVPPQHGTEPAKFTLIF